MINTFSQITQKIVVYVKKNESQVILFEKNQDNIWNPLVKTSGFIGKNGIGKKNEGDNKTPSGLFKLGIAFGIKDNPRNTNTIYKN